jgi:hypothetical protein
MTLRWDTVAQAKPDDPRDPADPAYDWSLYDPILQRLHAAHIAVLISLWGTPPWANDGLKNNAAPTDATSLASFAYAASTRFPWINRWTVWNEPNLRTFLVPNSPRVYVTRLLNPTYRALKSANPRNLVAGGVTSPRKTPTGVSPIAWIRGMRAAHALLNAYAQNPYPVRGGETPTSGGCWRCTEVTMATLPKLIAEVKRSAVRSLSIRLGLDLLRPRRLPVAGAIARASGRCLNLENSDGLELDAMRGLSLGVRLDVRRHLLRGVE